MVLYAGGDPYFNHTAMTDMIGDRLSSLVGDMMGDMICSLNVREICQSAPSSVPTPPLPTPAPTSVPTLSPTAELTTTIECEIAMTGLDVDAITEKDKKALKYGIASLLDGVNSTDIYNLVVSWATSRRLDEKAALRSLLTTDESVVTFDIILDVGESEEFTDPDDLSETVSETMEEIAEDATTFIAEVQSHTESDNFDTVAVESTSSVTLTRQPSPVPTTAVPTTMPTEFDWGWNTKSATELLAGIGMGMLIALVVVTLCVCVGCTFCAVKMTQKPSEVTRRMEKQISKSGAIEMENYYGSGSSAPTENPLTKQVSYKAQENPMAMARVGKAHPAVVKPPPPPMVEVPIENPWIESIDENSGNPFYYHKDTGETTWDKPY